MCPPPYSCVRPLTLGRESAAAFRPQKWSMPSDTLWDLFASYSKPSSKHPSHISSSALKWNSCCFPPTYPEMSSEIFLAKPYEKVSDLLFLNFHTLSTTAHAAAPRDRERRENAGERDRERWKLEEESLKEEKMIEKATRRQFPLPPHSHVTAFGQPRACASVGGWLHGRDWLGFHITL